MPEEGKYYRFGQGLQLKHGWTKGCALRGREGTRQRGHSSFVEISTPRWNNTPITYSTRPAKASTGLLRMLSPSSSGRYSLVWLARYTIKLAGACKAQFTQKAAGGTRAPLLAAHNTRCFIQYGDSTVTQTSATVGAAATAASREINGKCLPPVSYCCLFLRCSTATAFAKSFAADQRPISYC